MWITELAATLIMQLGYNEINIHECALNHAMTIDTVNLLDKIEFYIDSIGRTQC